MCDLSPACPSFGATGTGVSFPSLPRAMAFVKFGRWVPLALNSTQKCTMVLPSGALLFQEREKWQANFKKKQRKGRGEYLEDQDQKALKMHFSDGSYQVGIIIKRLTSNCDGAPAPKWQPVVVVVVAIIAFCCFRSDRTRLISCYLHVAIVNAKRYKYRNYLNLNVVTPMNGL